MEENVYRLNNRIGGNDNIDKALDINSLSAKSVPAGTKNSAKSVPAGTNNYRSVESLRRNSIFFFALFKT